MARQHHDTTEKTGDLHGYVLLGINLMLSLIVMYALMFSMIDGFSDFLNNINTFYMALTMVAPMGILMLLTMKDMYPRKALNAGLYVGLAIVFVASFAATRSQFFVGDNQFIASMIPHHSGAILMCREASLTDAELRQLCATISSGQRKEIEQMKAISVRLSAG